MCNTDHFGIFRCTVRNRGDGHVYTSIPVDRIEHQNIVGEIEISRVAVITQVNCHGFADVRCAVQSYVPSVGYSGCRIPLKGQRIDACFGNYNSGFIVVNNFDFDVIYVDAIEYVIFRNNRMADYYSANTFFGRVVLGPHKYNLLCVPVT